MAMTGDDGIDALDHERRPADHDRRAADLNLLDPARAARDTNRDLAGALHLGALVAHELAHVSRNHAVVDEIRPERSRCSAGPWILRDPDHGREHAAVEADLEHGRVLHGEDE